MTKKHALVIGVEKYESLAIKGVQYAENDANLFAETFKKIGYEEENVKVLVNQEATSSNIYRNFISMLELTESEDSFTMFFAGHGEEDEYGNQYLLCYDTEPGNIKKTSLNMSNYYSATKELNQFLLFIDACHSGMTITGLQRSIESKGPIVEKKLGQYQVGFASCRLHEKSYGCHKLEQGVWTHHVVKALNGEDKSLNANGKLTCNSLQNYLYEMVPTYVKENLNNDWIQTPWKFGGSTNELCIWDRYPLENNEGITTGQISKHSPLVTQPSAITNQFDVKRIREFTSSNNNVGDVRRLSGFNKSKGHKEPSSTGDSGLNFLRKISEDEIKQELQYIYDQVLEFLTYKESQLSIISEYEYSYLDCNQEFFVQAYITFYDDDPKKYRIHTEIVEFEVDPFLTKLIYNLPLVSFDEIIFSAKGKIDIKRALKIVEDSENLTYQYSPSNNLLEIQINDIEGALELKDNEQKIKFIGSTYKINTTFNELHNFWNELSTICKDLHDIL